MRLIVFASRKDKIYQLIVSTTVADGMAAGARASACVLFAWFSQGLKRCLNNSIFLYPLYLKDRGIILWFYVKAACRPLPSACHNGVNAITQKPLDGLFFKFGNTLIVIVPWTDYLFKVKGQVTVSRKVDFFITFSNINFWPHFCPISS